MRKIFEKMSEIQQRTRQKAGKKISEPEFVLKVQEMVGNMEKEGYTS